VYRGAERLQNRLNDDDDDHIVKLENQGGSLRHASPVTVQSTNDTATQWQHKNYASGMKFEHADDHNRFVRFYHR
jgi:hypothetical protein